MDAFLIDGMEIIFRLAVAILTFGKDDLLSLDMEGMLKVKRETYVKTTSIDTVFDYDFLFLFNLKYFQKEVPARFDPCPDPLFTAAYNVKYSLKRMKKWEKDYTTLKTKEQEDQEEVRVCNPIIIFPATDFVSLLSLIIIPYLYSDSERKTGCYVKRYPCWKPNLANWPSDWYAVRSAGLTKRKQLSIWSVN